MPPPRGRRSKDYRRHFKSAGIHEPGWEPILPGRRRGACVVGRLDEAEVVLQQLEEQAAVLRHRWATPAALRCRALLLLAREQSDEAAAAAEQAQLRSPSSAFRSIALVRS